VVDGQPAPVIDVGNVAYDVADRLAIINLFGAYAYTYDQNQLDDFRALFTESPELGLQLYDGTTVSRGVDTVMELLAVRKGEFKAQNNQRRHALNSFLFDSQSAEEATGRCYVQVFAIRDGGPTHTRSDGLLRVHCGQARRRVEIQPLGLSDRPGPTVNFRNRGRRPQGPQGPH
jgi:hypothetical protein